MITNEQQSRKTMYQVGYIIQIIFTALIGTSALFVSALYVPAVLISMNFDGSIIMFAFFSFIIYLIPLAWMIPMTLMMKRAMNDVGTINEKPHLVLGICAIIFSGILPGIFIVIGTTLFNSTQPQPQHYIPPTNDK